MSTRSMKAFLKKDGSIKMTYTHFDGYPDYMMPTLEYYSDPKLAEALIDRGETSCLGNSMDGDDTRFYADRGIKWDIVEPARCTEDVEGCKPYEFSSIMDQKAQDTLFNHEYAYVYSELLGKWQQVTRSTRFDQLFESGENEVDEENTRLIASFSFSKDEVKLLKSILTKLDQIVEQ